MPSREGRQHHLQRRHLHALLCALLGDSKPLVYAALAGCVLAVLGTLLVASGLGIQVDESLLLDAASQGYSIGAGLIYKTTDLLNAVVFGDELPMGLVATSTRVLQCAALSFRWDDKESCTVCAKERRGGRRDVTVHMGKAQLIKALRAAHAAGCRYVWCDRCASRSRPTAARTPQTCSGRRPCRRCCRR